MTPPDVALSAPGICHNLPLGGHPEAGDPTLANGVPVVRVLVGTLCGSQVVLDITSLTELGELEHAFRVAHARLSMWYQDHGMHPFDGRDAA